MSGKGTYLGGSSIVNVSHVGHRIYKTKKEPDLALALPLRPAGAGKEWDDKQKQIAEDFSDVISRAALRTKAKWAEQKRKKNEQAKAALKKKAKRKRRE